MRQYDNYIARFRSYWTDRTARGLYPVSSEAESSNIKDSRDSVRDKREASRQDSDGQVSGYRRKSDKNKCPTEIFQETLKLINELFPERKVI